MLVPAAAHAAAPVCSPATGLEANVQAGESITLPQAPCTDSDGDAISIEVTQAPTHGTVDPAGTQPIATQRTYTADADAGGETDVIKFRAVANGENSNEATLEINISENHAPVCPANIDRTVANDSQLALNQNPCTDADGDPLTLVLVDPPDHGTLDGSLTYTPNAGYVGQDSLTYRAQDASTQSNVGTVSITVTQGDRAPVCSPATGLVANVQAGEFINLPEAPCTDADGDPISIEITQAPVHGTLEPSGTQPKGTQRKYTADADAGGQTDIIKFRAVAGGKNSNVATLEIHIGANHAPVCPAQVSFTVESGKPLVIPKNPCTDADGDPLSFTLVDGPDHGTFTANNPAGPFTYTSQAGYVGPDRVTYRATDASAQSIVGIVSITVTAPPGTGGGTPPPVVTPPPPPDVTPPALSFKPPATTLRNALRRGLRVTIKAGEAGRATVRLLLSKRDARRLGVKRQVGRLTRTLSAGSTKLSVKLTRKARRRLARVRTVKLTLQVTITDAAGNFRRESRVLTLRRTG